MRNENLRRRNADIIRWVTNTSMAEHEPTSKAKGWFSRSPYQAGKIIRAQGAQMEYKDVLDYLAEKYNIKMGVGADEHNS